MSKDGMPQYSPSPALEDLGVGGRGAQILLAEDDADFRELLREALEAEGYAVVEAADGEQLDALLREAVVLPGSPKFDLVISDVRMPKVTGIEALEWNYARDPDTRFLLITAFGDDAIHARASEFDAHVIDKPFDLDELLVRVRASVERWGEGWNDGAWGAA